MRETDWDKDKVVAQAEQIIKEHAKEFHQLSKISAQIRESRRPLKEKISGKFSRGVRILLVGSLLLGTPGLLGLLPKPFVGRTEVEQTYWPTITNEPLVVPGPTPKS